MRKVSASQETQAIIVEAIDLYVKAGNPIGLWHAEDPVTRHHYLIAAAQAKDGLPEMPSHVALQ